MTGFWKDTPTIAILVVIALGLTVGVAGLGALGAFVVVMTTVLLARKKGSFRDLGLRAPDSWPRLLGKTILYGLLLQSLLLLVVEPALGRAGLVLRSTSATSRPCAATWPISWVCWRSAGWWAAFLRSLLFEASSWAVFPHGFSNTFGIAAIYLDIDEQPRLVLFT